VPSAPATPASSDPRLSPRLSWPGRAWVKGAGERAKGGGQDGGQPKLILEEAVENPTGRLIRGDALDVARALSAEGLDRSADLVYLDPPFASQMTYTSEARLDGAADGRVTRTLAYSDSWSEGGLGAYLDMLAPRLEAAAALLSDTGTLWVHLDWRASYLVRVLLDEILGRHRFINEIVWRRAPNLGRQAASGQFGRTLDTLLVYGGSSPELVIPTRLVPIEKHAIRWDDEGRPFTSAPRGDYTDASIEKLDAEGRVHRTAAGKVYIKYFLVKDVAGEWCRERRIDALWTDVAPLRHSTVSERTGFPTQKPRALLDRIVRCAAPEGGLVVDLFAGSGTTGEAAHACGRRFILADQGPVAIATARARLLRAGVAFSLERTPGLAAPEGPPPRARVRRSIQRGFEVELVDPTEPLAWAIDRSFDPDGPFRAIWHSERRPGTKTAPAEVVARLASADRLAIRVYGDDGTVSTREVGRPSAHPQEEAT
jgi:DNA modification methylase